MEKTINIICEPTVSKAEEPGCNSEKLKPYYCREQDSE